MKKLVLLSVTLLFALVLGACEGSSSDEIKVGFIYIGHVGDGGFTYSHDQGRLYLEQQLDVETKYVEAVPESSEVKDRMRELIDQGYNVIIANSFGYMDYVEELSKEYPDVKFLHCSGYKTTDNMGNYFGRIYQARYLTGIVAGLKTQTNKIGYVAAFGIPEVVRGINAFTLGVRSVNPDATVEVTWTNTWYNPTVERQAADALLDKGVDVIAQHQDTPEPQKAAEQRGVFAVGYHSDMNDYAPDAHLVSAVWNWGPYYVDQVSMIQEGTWETGSYWGGIDEAIVDITNLSKNATDDAESTVNDIYNDMKNGEFTVFSGEIKKQDGTIAVESDETLSDEELLSMNWFVEGVIGTIPSD
ncbi:BMP family ABC transporter substrate-binding protein [Haloplasma contractile]|uniref:Nucleoside-binding protein n=1 Tax=Haloplasma contractile SSD-17B TaxID=1033810 RepID=U2FE14_9MOLU|nr:BMP family ABC transporter substrate-binding protein [Haloplasma contractile]ERJ11215.1 Nucleoside-binding protein [Haloplasma contractile SSD-17B]